MQADHSVFDGEWWWPKWSDLSSIPLPPDHQPQNASTLRAFEHDLELGMKLPVPLARREFVYTENLGPDLNTYPTQLWHTSKTAAGFEGWFNTSQPIYDFRLLRYYDLSCITHKLQYLQGQLEAEPNTSYEHGKLLTKLLKDQGMLTQARDSARLLIDWEATAARDYEYMTRHLKVAPRSWITTKNSLPWVPDRFPQIELPNPNNKISGEYRTIPQRDSTTSRLANALINLLPKRVVFSKRDILRSRWAGFPLQGSSTSVRIIASIIIAVFGGALLIVPMVIMSFDTNRTKSLVTVSCSVILFGFFLGAVIRSKSSEIFVATATYAAVLVVFVGTGGSASG